MTSGLRGLVLTELDNKKEVIRGEGGANIQL